MDKPDPERIETFNKQLKRFLDYSWRKHVLYTRLNLAVALAGLALGSVITLLGASGYGFLAAVSGAVLTFLLGVQNFFKLAEKASVWEIKHNDAKGVRDRLIYKVRTEDDFQLLVNDWLELKRDLMEKMPQVVGLSKQGIGTEPS